MSYFPFVIEHTKEVNTLQWLIITGIGFVLLALLVMRWVWPSMIQPHLAERLKNIQENARQIETTLRETDEMRGDYRGRLERIHDETERRMEEAVREAESLREQILAEAQVTARGIVRRGEEEVGRERAKAMVTLNRQFVDGVIGAARYAASQALDGPSHSRLVDDFTRNLGASS